MLDGGGVRVPAKDETDKMIIRSHLHRRRYRRHASCRKQGGECVAATARWDGCGGVVEYAAGGDGKHCGFRLGMSIDGIGMVVSGKEVFL